MPRPRVRKKPNKTTAGCRRPGGPWGPALRMGTEDVLTGIMSALPLLAPSLRAGIHLWRRPAIQDRWPDYQHATANLAANVFDILHSEPVAAGIRQASYPRLHQLLGELDGAESLVQDGRYLFRHRATGRLIQLGDVPFKGR